MKRGLQMYYQRNVSHNQQVNLTTGPLDDIITRFRKDHPLHNLWRLMTSDGECKEEVIIGNTGDDQWFSCSLSIDPTDKHWR